jgi:hypothetical protein
MPNIAYGEDEIKYQCPCGYNICMFKARFKIMMRLHFKKCIHKRDLHITEFTSIVTNTKTSRVDMASNGVMSVL